MAEGEKEIDLWSQLGLKIFTEQGYAQLTAQLYSEKNAIVMTDSKNSTPNYEKHVDPERVSYQHPYCNSAMILFSKVRKKSLLEVESQVLKPTFDMDPSSDRYGQIVSFRNLGDHNIFIKADNKYGERTGLCRLSCGEVFLTSRLLVGCIKNENGFGDVRPIFLSDYTGENLERVRKEFPGFATILVREIPLDQQHFIRKGQSGFFGFKFLNL